MKKSSFILVISLLAIAVMTYMLLSISTKKQEQVVLNANPVVKAEGIESKNEEWRDAYPRQYDSWKKTAQSDKIEDLVKKYPQLAILWAGYGFSKDYNAPRGHFYALQDNINTLRTGAPTGPDDGPMPTACWTCKSTDVPRVIAEEGENEYFTGKWARLGNQIVNPIGCADCHNTQTGELQLSRPYLTRALESAGWVMKDVSYQDMRSLACAQCHSEYYFKKTPYTDKEGNKQVANVVTFPWEKGFTAEAMEEYYNSYGFSDWTHALSRTPLIKAQHPGYEIFRTGIHFKRGLSCADCHMPYKQEGSVKFSDHNLQSPLNDVANSCLTCHRQSEAEFKAIVEEKLERKNQLNVIAMTNLGKAHLEAKKAWDEGATEAEMAPVLALLRSSQWFWDYSIASHGSFFHAPEETLRLLAVANDKAQQARNLLVGILAQHGVLNYEAPDFSTKEKAQELANVNLPKLVEEKLRFKRELLPQWDEEAVKAGRLNKEWKEGMSDTASYPQ
ncbi:ammonia-forming cytochrome c nitrite reductase [Oleidesulfovibrio sp.]|uniref:ammonia-forming cytochrome c nitrite reductase n=1 Tax=Oleidesulfovibrio sp. TaxID=2909707 RepID=UPI003A85595C